jgi:hypothetical protein
MIMKVHPIPVFLTLALLLGLLTPVHGDDQIKGTDYFPLAPGSHWEYRSGDTRLSVKVAKDYEKVGNDICAVLETKVNGKLRGTEHLCVRGDGIYRVKVNDQPLLPAVLFFKLPPRKEAKWEVEFRIGDQTTKGAYQVEEEELKVNGKTYQTFVLKSTGFEVLKDKVIASQWFASGIGMVKQSIEMGGNKIVLELDEFVAGK